ncbi:unnamed protein product [Triticum turgidum subsp. durum]|uniref:X8 domain-containing protein n=1 Tax=Triticum turgidum subsp. durum TaxID=4567 RepID=A0A9R0S3L4_TRITD|nr:unnamed protein product [Triticum turgidum subsp. durum]
MLPSEAENSPSDLAKLVQSKQTKQARVCGGADHRLLRSLANTGAEVMVTVPNSRLHHMAEFKEEAQLWVAANVAPFLPATMITHVLAGDDVLSSSPGAAYSLVPAMLNLHAALAAARLDGRVRVSTALSSVPLAPSWHAGVAGHLLRFLSDTGSPLFLKQARAREAAADDDAYAAMRALGFSGVPLIAAEPEGLGGAVVYRGHLRHAAGGGGGRRSLAAGTFCVALQNADPAALQAGLSWACGQGQADCSAIQPGGACYRQNNLAALASYAYNDYYQKGASTGATCSFNGTATTTATDPSKHAVWHSFFHLLYRHGCMFSDSFMVIAPCRLGIVRLRGKHHGRGLQLERAERQPSDEPRASGRLQPSVRLRAPSDRLRPSRGWLRSAVWVRPTVWLRSPVGVRPAGELQRERDLRAERHPRALRHRMPPRRLFGRLHSPVRHCSCRPRRVARSDVNYVSVYLN